jgi:predicted HTH transcriptional regulator
VGIFGNEYGRGDDQGRSATEKEFDVAKQKRKRRLILVKGRDDKDRNPKMKALIRRAGDELVRRRFEDTDEMLRLLYGSLIQYLQDGGFIAAKDFDAAPCTDATLRDISERKIRWFIEKAREERGYALAPDTPPKKALSHLNLLAKTVPTKGAILLFSDAPERFINSAEVTCLHFHGPAIEKPIPSQQVYHGTLFEVVDKAVDFVMDRLRRRVQPRDKSPDSAVRYEIPYGVVREAIVNAVAHRNYASKSGIQVMVFSDRIEVWNPGGLPEDLTVEHLREPHPSVPRNRLICEPLFLAHYIERAGTGTLDMIRLCREAALPEPEFRSEGERFITVIWRDWLTKAAIENFRLNDRQKQAINYLKKHGRINNVEYQQLTKAIKKTATRDLADLKKKGIVDQIGTRGPGVHYVLRRKRDIMGTMGT